ncbi:MAG: hypothetical protein WAQ25_02560 [Candidatus Saccharimonas sp.]
MRDTFRRHWQRFRPHFRRRHSYSSRFAGRNRDYDAQHIGPREQVSYVCNATDFFDCAEEQVVALLQRRPEVHDLDRDIDRLRKKFEQSGLAHDGMVALLAQAPRAVLAQIQMDQHPHGYRDKHERLYELIDFNDTFVSVVLLLSDHERLRFAEATKQACDRICKRVGAPCYTNEQWTAIVRGLTREIAVYWAAKNRGLNVLLTSRIQDAMGIDLQVQDPETKRYINIDVKTPSSFRHRLEQLVKEGRLSERELLQADERSYCIETNGHKGDRVEVLLLCILPDLFGELAYFRFVNEEPMQERLLLLIRDHGLTDGRFGKV